MNDCLSCDGFTRAGRQFCVACSGPPPEDELIEPAAVCTRPGCGYTPLSRGLCQPHLADALVLGRVS